MKPILVATDFSDAAKDAAEFGAQLAQLSGAELIVFHCWSMPIMTSDGAIVPVALDEFEEAQQKAVNAEADRIRAKYSISVKGLQQVGFAAEEIANAAKSNHAGLVLMGMKPVGAVDKIFGGVSTAVMSLSAFPVLIVPQGVSFIRPKVFLFATDLKTSNNWFELDVLKELAGFFHAGIHILNVHDETALPTAEESKAGILLDNRLKELPHTWHFPNDGDIVHGIEKATTDTEADWVCVVPHRMNWIKNIFHKSISKAVAFDTHKPLLVLPEKHVHLEA